MAPSYQSPTADGRIAGAGSATLDSRGRERRDTFAPPGEHVFGRRKREEEAAAEAAREAERRALFAKLAERPEHVCPFLGLAADRTGFVDGVSDDHRCFAFGDPAPLSAEQQTRVCQERGYGNCPRYLRGVLVIPTEELEALRRPRTADAAAPPPPAQPRRRRRAPVLLGLLLLLLIGGGVGAWALLGGLAPTASATPTPRPSPSLSSSEPQPSVEPSVEPSTSAAPSGPASPTPEPTPTAGDEFAFYEVSVAPGSYDLYSLDDNGEVSDTLDVPFDAYSFARAEPVEAADGTAYWVTLDGDLTGWAYRYPDSGDFRVRAVFRSSDGERRSEYLEQDELTAIPEATPAP